MSKRTRIRITCLAVLIFAVGAHAAEPGSPDQSSDSARAHSTVASDFHRVEFISFQLAYGLLDGTIYSVVRRHQSTDYGFGQIAPEFPLGEAALRGLGATTWLILHRDFTASEGMSINVATFWAHAWSVLLAYSIQGNDHPYPTEVGSIAGFAGTVAGAFLGMKLQPEPGALAMANSGAAWAAVLALIFRSPFTHFNADWKVTFGAIDAASIAGFAGGLLLSRFGVPPRGSVLLVDLGGIAGVIAGALVASALDFSGSTSSVSFAAALGGFTAFGLGAGALVTHFVGFGFPSWVAQAPSLSLAPTARGGFGLAVQSMF